MSAADIEVLADLPSRDTLLAQFAGALSAPLQQLAGLVQALPRNLAYGLSALLEQRQAEARRRGPPPRRPPRPADRRATEPPPSRRGREPRRGRADRGRPPSRGRTRRRPRPTDAAPAAE